MTIEEAIESGISCDELSVNEDTIKILYELKGELEDSANLSKNDLSSIGNKLSRVQLDIIKTKLAAELGVEEGNIEIKWNSDETSSQYGGYILVTNTDGTETKYEAPSTLESMGITKDKNNISTKIRDYIKIIIETQNLSKNISQADILKHFDENVELLLSYVEETEKFATGEISIDENGNISYESLNLEGQNESQKEINLSHNGNER